MSDPEKARFILDHFLNGLRRMLHRLKPLEGKISVWSDYMTANNNYRRNHLQVKQRFVGGALTEFPSRLVLDVGCNPGHFSAIADCSGPDWWQWDYDVWRNARREKPEFLPLAVNLRRPSPVTRWRYRECAGFLDRVRGR